MPQIQFEGYQRSISNTSQTLLAEFEISQLRALLVVNLDSANSIYIGKSGVSTTNGIRVAYGETFGLSHQDFKKDDRGLLQLYGLAETASVTVAVAKVYVE